MKRMGIAVICVLSAIILLLFTLGGPVSAQGDIVYTFEHTDPAGDVLKYNATLNGTASEDFEGMDIKHLNSERSGDDLIMEMNLKAKEKFRKEDETKYVFRILTSPDNSTGYNITYRNGSTTINSFEAGVNGTSVDISDNVTFVRDKGDEAMQITLVIPTYLDNITHYGLDAYSLMITHNATYLDYISELPGHPTYVNPEVADEEDLPTVDDDDDDDDKKDENSVLLFIGIGICLIIGVIVVAILIVVGLMIFVIKKSKK